MMQLPFTRRECAEKWELTYLSRTSKDNTLKSCEACFTKLIPFIILFSILTVYSITKTSSRLISLTHQDTPSIWLDDLILTQGRHRNVRKAERSYSNACQAYDRLYERWSQWSVGCEKGISEMSELATPSTQPLIFMPYLDKCLYIATFTLRFNLEEKHKGQGNERARQRQHTGIVAMLLPGQANLPWDD